MSKEVDLSKSVDKLKTLEQSRRTAETAYQELKKSVLDSLFCPLCKSRMFIMDRIENKKLVPWSLYPVRVKTGVYLTCCCGLSTGVCDTEEEAIEQFLIIQEALKSKEK